MALPTTKKTIVSKADMNATSGTTTAAASRRPDINKNNNKRQRRCVAITTTTTSASASGCIRSSWKSIRDQVRKQMEQQLKLGTQFPKLPTNTDGEILLTTGLDKTKSNSYKVRVCFHKKRQYLGCWKRPEQAAQAYRYAKELIDDGDGNGINTCDQVSHEGSNENQQSKKRRCSPYSPHVPWQTRYGELVEFRINYGNTNVPQNYAKNIKLGQWVSTQRSQYNTSTLTQERIDQLNELNFEWSLRSNQRLNTIEMTKTGLERMKKQQAERERKQAERERIGTPTKTEVSEN